MERRSFIKNGLIATGGALLGSAGIYRLLNTENEKDDYMPAKIENVSEGNGKRILVLMSAGTRKGNTDCLTDSYIKGMAEKGHSITKVYLGSMQLAGCRGCGACQRNGNRCVVQDDMQQLYPLFNKSDVIVMASPIYFWTITAKLKSFVERLYAISVHDRYPVKETALLMTAGDDGETTFDQAKSYWNVISGVLGNKSVATYFAGGCKGCEADSRYISAEHLNNAYNLGRLL